MIRPCFLLVFCLAICFSVSACKQNSGDSYIECGGSGNFICPPGMYCEYGPGCGGIDRVGTCKRQPPTCPVEDAPICGCDDVTYDSACYANASGISVAYEGPCIEKGS